MRRGELLAGFEDDQSEPWSSWLNFERDRLRLAWRDAALARIATDIDTAEAIELSTRLLEADPLDEIALRAHMACLTRGGMSAQARQAYRDFADRLAEISACSGAELRALHDSLGATVTATRLEAPPDAIGDDTFIGRSVELQGIGARWRAMNAGC
jgi:DNA-binding SARP family transcriptional activator